MVHQSDVLRPISGRVDGASATETVDSGSIPSRVKPKTMKLVFLKGLFAVSWPRQLDE